jgi:hypothetical protein
MKIIAVKTLIMICLGLALTVNLILEPLASTPARSLDSANNNRSLFEPRTKDFKLNLTKKNQTPRAITKDSEYSLFLPLIYLDRQDPDIGSPFSLQIAALSQLLADSVVNENESYANLVTDLGSVSVNETAYGSLKSALMDSGADWTRVRVEWEVIEPAAPVPGQPPEYGWQFYDEALRIVAEAGVRITVTLSDSPSWAASVPCAPIFADRLDDFARFLKDLVNRYKVPPYLIKHWELVNEPDSNRYTSGHNSGHGCWAYDGDQYAQMLAVANQAIKEADPRATVLMGGIAYDWFEEYGGPFYRYFSDEVMENGGGDHIDALNFHYFPDFRAEWDRWNPQSADRRYDWIPAPTCGVVDDGEGTPYDVEGFDIMAKATHFRNRMEVCHGVAKPVWVTEVGEHGYPDDQESLDNQARYVIKVYARALSAGIENISWFSLDSPPYDSQGQALLNPDFSPKPAFFAYQTLTRELDGYYEYSHSQNICSWSRSGASCSLETYTFKDDNQNAKMVAWGKRSLTFTTSKLRVVDRNGVESIIMDGGNGDLDGKKDGSVEVKLTQEPIFISIQ